MEPMEPADAIEVTASSVEEAIEQGLADLGCQRDEVEITVLSEGSRGFLGIGAQPARVLLTRKAPVAEEIEVAKEPEGAEDLVEPEEAEETGVVVEEDDEPLRIAREVVSELLEKMHVQATVETRYGESDNPRVHPILVEIHGRDLGVLIGPRGQTLDALQYISRLIVSKELQKGVTLVIDVEGHRQRREKQLRRLARRMADQAIRTGKRMVLEPMSARDRRVIHVALRDDPRVTTESVGEEPRRKVTIIPKARE